jgi:hypothetical protein
MLHKIRREICDRYAMSGSSEVKCCAVHFCQRQTFDGGFVPDPPYRPVPHPMSATWRGPADISCICSSSWMTCRVTAYSSRPLSRRACSRATLSSYQSRTRSEFAMIDGRGHSLFEICDESGERAAACEQMSTGKRGRKLHFDFLELGNYTMIDIVYRLIRTLHSHSRHISYYWPRINEGREFYTISRKRTRAIFERAVILTDNAEPGLGLYRGRIQC